MGLRFDPVGGGQFKQAVKQIIEAESQPLKAMEARKAKENTRLKLFQEFKTKFSGLDKALQEMSTFRKFRDLKVDLGDGADVISVTIDKDKAEPGQYQIEISELSTRTSVISNGFEDPNETILGVGYVTMSLQNGESAEIFVDDEHSSLRGVASLINREPLSPVRAAVIKDDSSSETEAPWKLLLTGKKEGEANQIDFPEFYFLDGAQDFFIEDDREASNAKIALDGFPFETTSNDINEFLPGVNLHLKQARPERPVTLTISEDTQKISGKVKGLVDQLNQVLQFIIQQNTVDQNSDTTTTFAGDSSLQSMEYQLRNAIHRGFPVRGPEDSILIVNMNQLGVEFEKNGILVFKEEKFNKSLEKNFDQIAEAITGPQGFVQGLRGLLDSYTRAAGGVLQTKEQGLRSRIRQIDDQIDQKTRLLEKRKQDLTDKFSRLEATLGNLQRQQQFLAATVPSGGGGNMVSQLLGG